MTVPFADRSHRAQVARLRALAAAALARYDLGGQPAFRLQLHLANTTLRVSGPDGARYVLRVSQPNYRTDAELRSEAQWLDALRRETDLGVPEPVLNRAGDFLTHAGASGVPEVRQCTLFRWLDGRFAHRRLEPVHLRRVGALTARLHAHAMSWQPPPGFTRPRLDTRPWVAAWLEEDAIDPESRVVAPEDRALLREAATRIVAAIDTLGTTPDRFGLIHTDLHQGNYLFHSGEARAIDYDDSGFEHYVYDLAVTLWGLTGHPRYEALREALLAGYEAVRPLPIGTDTHLDSFIAARHLIVAKYVIGRADNPGVRAAIPYFVDRAVSCARRYL